MTKTPIVLGSSAKWRKAILEQIVSSNEEIATLFEKNVQSVSPDIDEKKIRHENAETLVLLLANAKADAIIEKEQQLSEEGAVLVTADQVVRYKDEIREKPESIQQAKKFLSSYAEEPAETVTGVVVTNLKTGKRWQGVDTARVLYRGVPESIIEKVAHKEDILYCAGGFMIEDEDLRPYMELDGEEESVIGLPKSLLQQLLLSSVK